MQSFSETSFVATVNSVEAKRILKSGDDLAYFKRLRDRFRHIHGNQTQSFLILNQRHLAVLYPDPEVWKVKLAESPAFMECQKLYDGFDIFLNPTKFVRQKEFAGPLSKKEVLANCWEMGRPELIKLNDMDARNTLLPSLRITYRAFLQDLKRASQRLPVSYDEYLKTKSNPAVQATFGQAKRVLLSWKSSAPERWSAIDTILRIYPNILERSAALGL